MTHRTPRALVVSSNSLAKIAHDSGDGQTVFHCPFCGSGQVIARSDRTIECAFCNTAFTVQVQPMYAGFPQTIDGQAVPVPGMPGQISPMGLDPAADPSQVNEDGDIVEDPEADAEQVGDPSEGDDAEQKPPFMASRRGAPVYPEDFR